MATKIKINADNLSNFDKRFRLMNELKSNDESLRLSSNDEDLRSDER